VGAELTADEEAPLKVLIVAHDASTVHGGEAVLPVHYFRGLRALGHPVKLIAHERNRADLESHFGSDCDALYFVRDTRLHRAIWRAGVGFPAKIEEALFGNLMSLLNEVHQKRLIRDLVAAGEVEVIHQPMPVSPKAPSSIHGFGVPVIVGPMNGGMTWPDGYEDFQRRSERLFARTGRALSAVVHRLIPGKRRAAALVVANQRTRDALPPGSSTNVIELVENGVDLSTWHGEGLASGSGSEDLVLVFMGRLVAWKALDLTLHALRLALDEGVRVRLEVLGDGKERQRLQQLAAELGLENHVQFLGFRPQSECVEILRRADALILNSLYECGGAVVLEAMSMGLPVIGPDWGGPADYLDETCGILVHPSPRETYPARIAQAIGALAADPDLRRRMGRAGAMRARQDFDWAVKVEHMVSIYRSAVGRQPHVAVAANGRPSSARGNEMTLSVDSCS
jgi:glycosyltransferase involved in cell wall biosynthesis